MDKLMIAQRETDCTGNSPALGKQTLKNGTTLLIFDGHNKLICLHHIVLIDAGTHLKATELAGIAASNGATTNATQGHAIDLLAILHVVVIHVHPTTFARDLPVVGRISAEKEREKERESEFGVGHQI